MHTSLAPDKKVSHFLYRVTTVVWLPSLTATEDMWYQCYHNSIVPQQIISATTWSHLNPLQVEQPASHRVINQLIQALTLLAVQEIQYQCYSSFSYKRHSVLWHMCITASPSPFQWTDWMVSKSSNIIMVVESPILPDVQEIRYQCYSTLMCHSIISVMT